MLNGQVNGDQSHHSGNLALSGVVTPASKATVGIIGVISRSNFRWKACIVSIIFWRTAWASMKSDAVRLSPLTEHSSRSGSTNLIWWGVIRRKRRAFDEYQMAFIAGRGSGKPGSAASTMAPAASNTFIDFAIASAMRGSTTLM